MLTSPLYNICTRCGRTGHCAASCKGRVTHELTGAAEAPPDELLLLRRPVE